MAIPGGVLPHTRYCLACGKPLTSCYCVLGARGTPIPMADMTMSMADYLDSPLPTAQPATWSDKVRRVEWILARCTDGELAYLYKILHDGRDMRRANVDAKIAKEKS